MARWLIQRYTVFSDTCSSLEASLTVSVMDFLVGHTGRTNRKTGHAITDVQRCQIGGGRLRGRGSTYRSQRGGLINVDSEWVNRSVPLLRWWRSDGSPVTAERKLVSTLVQIDGC